MDINNIEVGDTVWLLDRARVRSGAGPQQVVVADTAPDGDNHNTHLFRVAGTRGWYVSSQAYATENEARLAWFEKAEAELKRETARYNKIAARLSAWQATVGGQA